MTETKTRHISNDDSTWPSFAPTWAERATIDPQGEVTFERSWIIPSQFRDTTALTVIRVDQEWGYDDHGGFVPSTPPRVVASAAEVWADWRAREVAATLREIASALDPEPAPVAVAS